MLYVVHLLQLFVDYYDTRLCSSKPIQNIFYVYIDTQSRIKKLQQMMGEYVTAPLETILHPYWDVLQSLHVALK